MLFNAKINEIQSQVSANSLEIEALLLRVEELRAQNLAMENHLQQLGSAENAAESAIEQIKTALMMINAISPTEVMTFKGAIDSLFDCERPQLAACGEPVESAVDPEPEPEPEPSEDADDEYGFPVTEHYYQIVEEQGFSGEHLERVIQRQLEKYGPNGNGHGEIIEMEDLEIGVSDIEAALSKLGINALRKLAKAKRLDSKGTKFILIKRLIGAGITEADLIG